MVKIWNIWIEMKVTVNPELLFPSWCEENLLNATPSGSSCLPAPVSKLLNMYNTAGWSSQHDSDPSPTPPAELGDPAARNCLERASPRANYKALAAAAKVISPPLIRELSAGGGKAEKRPSSGCLQRRMSCGFKMEVIKADLWIRQTDMIELSVTCWSRASLIYSEAQTLFATEPTASHLIFRSVTKSNNENWDQKHIFVNWNT